MEVTYYIEKLEITINSRTVENRLKVTTDRGYKFIVALSKLTMTFNVGVSIIGDKVTYGRKHENFEKEFENRLNFTTEGTVKMKGRLNVIFEEGRGGSVVRGERSWLS